mmetsp:Transcript_19509/g.25361  ORF Transcript_19509/g.25361 Transcript_19509/m.25361 type:complete len:364 (-) Transcript_19509:203-1294(-)
MFEDSRQDSAFAQDPEETQHFEDCVLAFKEYSMDMMGEVARREKHMNSLPVEHKAKLKSETLRKFEGLKTCVRANQEFFEQMISQYRVSTGSVMKSEPHHMSKVRLVLHQIAREWSEEGNEERSQCFDPILEQLKKHCSPKDKVLCPGAGLGRLPVEIVGAGYACEGNEFSYHMLLVSDFIMNKLNEENEKVIHPWLDGVTNVYRSEDLTRPVKIPDRTTRQIMTNNEEPLLSMCAGEFIQSYKNDRNTHDCVVTCFFIDTAANVFKYIETIHAVLKPGGKWINHGPLMWHWYAPGFTSNPDVKQEARYDESVELSYDELKAVIESYGFKFLHESKKTCNYSSNIKSMMSTVYNTVLFTCTKE